jgi:hypothetical protein
MRPEIIHCVMGGGIVVASYKGPRSYDHAWSHSRCVTGTEVCPLDISTLPPVLRAIIYAELLTELPEDIKRDIEMSEWEYAEDVTPVEDAVPVAVDEFDDQDR